MSESARLKIGFIAAGQVDKATTHNEALALLDIAVAAAVDGFLTDTPPAAPMAGQCYVVGSAPTGAWLGHSLALAGYTEGGWRFVAPVEGLSVLDKASSESAVFRDGAWAKGDVRAVKLSIGGNQVVGSRGAGIANPAGGTTIDVEVRAAVADILARLRHHGLIAS